MKTPITHTVTTVVDLFQTSTSTVRRWSAEFSRHLSPYANPGKGNERQYTDDDLRVFAYVHRRTAAGIPVKQIDLELDTANLPTLAEFIRGVSAVPDDTLVMGLTGFVTSNQNTQRLISETLDRIADSVDVAVQLDALRREVDELRRRVVDLERQKHGHKNNILHTPVYDAPQEPNA